MLGKPPLCRAGPPGERCRPGMLRSRQPPSDVGRRPTPTCGAGAATKAEADEDLHSPVVRAKTAVSSARNSANSALTTSGRAGRTPTALDPPDRVGRGMSALCPTRCGWRIRPAGGFVRLDGRATSAVGRTNAGVAGSSGWLGGAIPRWVGRMRGWRVRPPGWAGQFPRWVGRMRGWRFPYRCCAPCSPCSPCSSSWP